jgi:predicted Zn-dependent protease
MAFIGNNDLFTSSFAQYDQFLQEHETVTGTPEADMVNRLGLRIKEAAELWLSAEGHSDYLKDYQWEYHLVKSDEVNAWCMPGGKIVVYTGILPITQNEDSLAVVMGHEVSHALLNHGQQRMSASVLQELGAVGVSILLSNASPATQDLALQAYGIGTSVGGTLPFSRTHESEADYYGLILMALAGYDPNAAVPFWQRMADLGGGGTPEFLSTHPSDKTRIENIQKWIPEVQQKAAELNG